ncbi:TonB-dependent receptor [Helicobacter sp. T3_23-1059]
MASVLCIGSLALAQMPQDFDKNLTKDFDKNLTKNFANDFDKNLAKDFAQDLMKENMQNPQTKQKNLKTQNLQNLQTQQTTQKNPPTQNLQNQQNQTTQNQRLAMFSTQTESSQTDSSQNQNLNNAKYYDSLQAQDLGTITASAKGFESKIDELNRNVYIIDKDTIEQKGFKTTEEIFSYIPFITRNSIGLGTNLDLRGQGSASNVNVQVLLNGINQNMLDSSHGVTPINTIAPSDIERIEVLPGGGAVMYGNGTRGGVINIITKRRYESFSPSVGISYLGVPQAWGSKYKGLYGEINADMRLAGKITKGLYYGISGRFLHKSGYRVGDKSNAYNVGGNLSWDITQNHSLGIEASYFSGYITTSPNLLFAIGTQVGQPSSVDNSPDKSKRYNSGEGLIKTKQDRIDTSIVYDAKFAENHKFQAKAFFHYLKNKYTTNLQDVWYARGNASMWVEDFSQSGSYFIDEKIGLNLRYDYKHYKGLLIVGFDSIYNIGERFLSLHYDLPNVNMAMPTMPTMTLVSMNHYLHTPIIANKWTNSIYAIEKFDITKRFSLTFGARYENANYTGKRRYSNNQGMLITMQQGQANVTVRNTYPASPTPTYNTRRPDKAIKNNISNYALELASNYKFGTQEQGNVYAKYEKGFRSPNPDTLTGVANSIYVDSNVKSEEYHTFEVGSKAQIGKFVFLSGSVFYTLTQNELYNYGSAHSGLSGFGYRNYDLTQRTGVEIFSKQEFFNQSLRFSESFTYVDARILKGTFATDTATRSMNGQKIPYTSNYKATIGINYDITRNFGIWTQNSFIGRQKDIVGGNINAYSLTDLGFDMRFGDFSATLGVRNVFDTLYFSYYNSDASDPTIGNSYLYAKGREVFLDLRYAF